MVENFIKKNNAYLPLNILPTEFIDILNCKTHQIEFLFFFFTKELKMQMENVEKIRMELKLKFQKNEVFFFFIFSLKICNKFTKYFKCVITYFYPFIKQPISYHFHSSNN